MHLNYIAGTTVNQAGSLRDHKATSTRATEGLKAVKVKYHNKMVRQDRYWESSAVRGGYFRGSEFSIEAVWG